MAAAGRAAAEPAGGGFALCARGGDLADSPGWGFGAGLAGSAPAPIGGSLPGNEALAAQAKPEGPTLPDISGEGHGPHARLTGEGLTAPGSRIDEGAAAAGAGGAFDGGGGGADGGAGADPLQVARIHRTLFMCFPVTTCCETRAKSSSLA